MSSKRWSIILTFGQKIVCNPLNLTATLVTYNPDIWPENYLTRL